MRAAVLHRPGPADAFRLESLPDPVPGPDEALVDVFACAVSARDVVERNGTYRRDVTFPLIQGLEIAGVVRAVGSAVPDLEPGDRVCTKAFSSCGRCRLCRNGRETTCQSRRPVRGGYAERVALPWDALVRFPDSIPFEVACTLGPAVGVALNAVRDVARVQLGETVLVTGAAGGVGHAAVQLARLAGARVLTHTRSAAKVEDLQAAGADAVVVSPDGDFAAEVRQLTGGAGVDAVIDTVGSPVFAAAFSALAVHGRYACVGQVNGEEAAINLARIFFKRAHLLGVGSVSRSQLEDTIALVAAGRIRPRVDRTLPLAEVATAHRLIEDGALCGRVVLTPQSNQGGD